MKRLFKFILGLIITVFVFFAIIETAFILMKDENGVTHFGEYIPVSIKDDSMEPTIMINDLILNKEVSNTETIKENDIISYIVETNNKKEIKTGRVVSLNQNNGSISYQIKGDNQGEENQVTVNHANIVGLYTNTKLLYLGGLIGFLESQNGFLICIIIPLFLIFFYQLCKLIGTIFKDKKEAQEEFEEEQEVKQEENEAQKEEVKKERENIEKEIPKEDLIKIEKQKSEEIDDTKLDIPIVVDEPIPSFTEPNIESINMENEFKNQEIQTNKEDEIKIPEIPINVEESKPNIEIPEVKEQPIIEPKLEIPQEEEDIEIL